jgi:hypothetical protein
MATEMRGPHQAGVLNPYAMVEVKLGRRVDWPNVADRQRFIQTVLDFPYHKLFDPRHGSPLYPGRRFDPQRQEIVHDRYHAPMINAANRLEHLNRNVLGAGAAANTTQQWVSPGVFFTNSPDFSAPVQGYLPDCHFISALAALAWSDPYAIIHAARPVANPADSLTTGGAMDRIFFYDAPGAVPTAIETSELLPLIEPGNVLQYARSGHAGEIWPAVYEKAWVKWFTHDTSDQPDYSKVTGGDPVSDLVSLTGKQRNSYATAAKTGEQIWQTVRAHCQGSWTFDPMVATTYGSAADAPTPIDYDASGIVADHCYAILGWQYVNRTKYIVLRNPWGYQEATTGVDVGPWTSFDQFDDGDMVGTLPLPEHGVFALDANTFQQYFGWYGWVD